MALLVIFYASTASGTARKACCRSIRRPTRRLRRRGWRQHPAAGGVGRSAVLMSGTWKPGIVFDRLSRHARTAERPARPGLVASAAVAAPHARACRLDNGFSWGPMLEVAKLFAGIFVTMHRCWPCCAPARTAPSRRWSRWSPGPTASPTTAVLLADRHPVELPRQRADLSGLLQPGRWRSGHVLMGELATTLAAISAGAVFMGANSYIGNAPNFMVKAIAEEAACECPASSATWPGRAASWCRCSWC
jgi:hypothetical protein